MDLVPQVSGVDHARGPAHAPVTLVDYGDYECPYCAQAHEVARELLSRHGGGLRYVFRNYPLVRLHPHAMHAALVAETAGGDEFWALHGAIYAHQDALDDESLVGYARGAGVSADRARGGLGGATRAKVMADLDGGERSHVQGTPTFYINGRRHDGEWGIEALSKALGRAGARRP